MNHSARGIVGQAKKQQNQQPEDRSNNHRFCELLTGVLDMHEEKHDQKRLYGRDDQRNNRVKRAKVNEGHRRR